MPMQNRSRNGGASPKKEGGKPKPPSKHTILAILLIACALLVLISLVTYDPSDEANADVRMSHLWGVVRGDPVARQLWDTTHNGLGLVGVIVSDFLIRSTVGYSVIAFPLLLLMWGWTMLRKGDYPRAVTFTNYTVVWAILIAAGFGMLRRILPDSGPAVVWSGAIGEFLSTVLSHLIGRAGGSIVVAVAMFITIIMSADLDVRQMAERMHAGWLKMMDAFNRWREAREEERVQREAEEEARREQEAEEEPELDSEVPTRDSKGSERSAETTTPRQAPVRITRAASTEPSAGDEFPAAKPTATRVLNFIRNAAQSEESATASDDGAVTTQPPVQQEDIAYVYPTIDLLDAPKPGKEEVDEAELKANAELLRETLLQFDVELESVSVTPGPVVTLYELVPAVGVKISQIVSLENDIALKLAARGIRIMAPIPGKSAVGVEIPNSHRSLVTIRSILNSSAFRDAQASLPLALGKTIAGEVFTDDLSRMPHILMAGSTGSGKSVGINTMLASLLYRMHPAELKVMLIDPKKIELAQYAKLKSHFLTKSPDFEEDIVTTPNNAVLALKGAELEMERRYDLLSKAAVRNIQDYNTKLTAGELKDTEEVKHVRMPYLVVVIDELADLMITAAREVEEPIARLAQLARAVGMHMIVATQRPSVDVITGVIKANFPARIAYQVASKTDSRTILDMNGAEQLLGNGDMLYLASGSPKPVRLQNAYISPREVDALVDHIGNQQGYAQPFLLPSAMEKRRATEQSADGGRDALFEEAAHVIVRYQQGSVSLLQRRLKIGYSRAARLVDELEAAGIVGPADGSKAREVMIASESHLDDLLQG
jgi:DNA segregation ATPase FtsK/SpoIIIE, S-DNA-T family